MNNSFLNDASTTNRELIDAYGMDGSALLDHLRGAVCCCRLLLKVDWYISIVFLMALGASYLSPSPADLPTWVDYLVLGFLSLAYPVILSSLLYYERDLALLLGESVQ